MSSTVSYYFTLKQYATLLSRLNHTHRGGTIKWRQAPYLLVLHMTRETMQNHCMHTKCVWGGLIFRSEGKLSKLKICTPPLWGATQGHFSWAYFGRLGYRFDEIRGHTFLLPAVPRVTTLEQNTSSSFTALTCTSTGSPPTTVTWAKDGVTLPANETMYSFTQTLVDRATSTYNNTLTIDASFIYVIGSYSCRVSNSIGTSSVQKTEVKGTNNNNCHNSVLFNLHEFYMSICSPEVSITILILGLPIFCFSVCVQYS